MRNEKLFAVYKGVGHGISTVLVYVLFRHALKAPMDSSGGWILSVLFIMTACVIIGLYLAFFIGPLFAEGIANAMLGQSRDTYEPISPLEKARCLVLQERFEEAAECYQETIDSEWIPHELWLEITDFHLNKLESPEGAVDILTKAIDDQQWEMADHIALLHKLADIHYYELGSRPAAEGLYKFIEMKYGSTPYGQSFLERSLSMFKPKTESQPV